MIHFGMLNTAVTISCCFILPKLTLINALYCKTLQWALSYLLSIIQLDTELFRALETDIVMHYCWLLQWNRHRCVLLLIAAVKQTSLCTCWWLQSKQTSLCAMLIATVTRFVLFLPVDINIVRCPYSTQLFCIFSYFVLHELNTVTEYYSESGQTLQLNTAVNHFALSRHHSWILQWIKSYCPNTIDEYYSESIRAVQTLQMNTTVDHFVLSKHYSWGLQ